MPQRLPSDLREGEYRFGRRSTPLELGVPRRRLCDDATRPLAQSARPSGPTLQDLARLDSGELTTLRLARYRLDRRLGKGGMASVYQGMHATLGRPVAVKVLTRDLCEHPDALERFLTEARLNATVHHPNVVEALDFGSTPEGLAYLVMDLHEGEDLRALLRGAGPLDWTRTRALVLQLCDAIEAVHAHGIVHRDVKPSNCLHVIEEGVERVLLADFGVACKLGAPESALVGTPEYMSPEQALGGPIDTRSDIYSLGILLGELLTGRVPFTGKSVSAVLDGHVHEAPPRLRELAASDVTFPDALEAIYARALAKEPGRRFASAREFADALLAVDGVQLHCARPALRSTPRDRTLRGRPFVRPARARAFAFAAGIALLFGVIAGIGGAATALAATHVLEADSR